MNLYEMHKMASTLRENALFVPKMWGATAGTGIAGMAGGAGIGAGLGALYGAAAPDVDPAIAALIGAGGGAALGQFGGQLAGHGLGVKWNKYPVNPRNYLLPLAGMLPGAALSAYGARDDQNISMPMVLGGLGLSGAGMLAAKKFMKH